MGKDSEYYKKKKNDQLLQLRGLIKELPGFVCEYIYSKELTAQTSTLVSYTYDILSFFRFLTYSNPIYKDFETSQFLVDDIKDLRSEDIIEYQRYLELNTNPDTELRENGKKAIARKMSALRGLFHYLYIHEYIAKDPMILVPMPVIKKDKNIVRMNPTEINDLLNAIEFGNSQMTERQRKICEKTRQRDLAILTLMLGTGIRVSECAGLDVTDVDFVDNSLTIVRKGGGQDIIYFGEEVENVLLSYIEGERKLIHPVEGQEKALFYSMKNQRISVDAIENLVKKYAKMAVPNKKITPHKLRSTYGTSLYRQTGDIRLVADVLGHENVNTTIAYYAAIEDEHKRQAADAVSLREKQDDDMQ